MSISEEVEGSPTQSPAASQFSAGLTQEEASRRLAEDGYNELPTAKRRSIVAIAWEVLHEPMLLLLVGAGVVYLFLGDLEEAVLLLASSFVVIGITLYQ